MRNLFGKHAVFLLIFFFGGCATYQQVRPGVSGRIEEAGTGRGIEGATLAFLEDNDEWFSKENGVFVIPAKKG